MITKLMQLTEKKIVASMEKGVKAGRDIAIAVGTLFDKWEENDEYALPAEWLAERFDFSKQYIYKMDNIAKRFLSCEGCDKYEGIGVSVLAEALPLNDAQFDEYLDECEDSGLKVTQKSIREYVKKCKMIESKAAEAEEAEETEAAEAEEAEAVKADYTIDDLISELKNLIERFGKDDFMYGVNKALHDID